jgi:hypothetical protein
MISLSPSEDQQIMINLIRQFASDEMRKEYHQSDETGQIHTLIVARRVLGFSSSYFISY